MSETAEQSKLSNPPEEAKFSRVACDQCHRCKLRCTRELPRCERCSQLGSPCTFSTGKPIGKPRGRKNRNSTSEAVLRKEKLGQTVSDLPQVEQSLGHIANKRIQGTVRSPSPVTANTSTSSTRQILQVHGILDSNDTFRNCPFQTPTSGQYLSSPRVIQAETRSLLEFQTTSRFDGSAADPADLSCACSHDNLSIFSALHQAHRQPSSVHLDQSLSTARKSILLCGQTLNCHTCRDNSGMLLFLPLIHSALSYYQKLLSNQILLSPKMGIRGQNCAVSRINSELGVVAIGGLEINEDLQGRIIDAVVKTEIRAGIAMLVTFEQVLMNDINSIDQNVKIALRQLALALIEQFTV